MDKMFQINDVSQKCGDVVQHAERFLPFAQQKMGFNKPVNINFLSDPENAKNPLGKTAYYDPNDMKIVVFVDKRHLKDIMRSLSHELVHHTQNCRGDLEGDNYTGPGYAQKDKHMRKMEGQAYLHGNLCFRDWEDSLKRENSEMNETKLRKYVNNLIKEVLEEAELKNPEKADLDKDGKLSSYEKKRGKAIEKSMAAEAKDVDEINPDSMEETVDEVKDKCAKCKKEGKPCPKDCPGRKKMEEELNEADDPKEKAKATVALIKKILKKSESKTKARQEVKRIYGEEGEKLLDKLLKDMDPKDLKDYFKEPSTDPVPVGDSKDSQNENWHKGNKDQLLFERLTKKWAK